MTTELRLVVDGIEYVAEIADPACGSWHYHPEPHPDGSPGELQHHHHDAKCEDRSALLMPVTPTRPMFDDAVHDHPDKYRTRIGADGKRAILSPEEAARGNFRG